MTHKQVLLSLEEDKLHVFDLYCSKNNISRSYACRNLIDELLAKKKVDIIGNAESIVSYLKKYESTKNFQESNYIFYQNKNKKAIDVETREKIKEVAKSLSDSGFGDEATLFLDISLWQRYLEYNSKDPKSFLDYVDWRYTNPNGLTY